MKRFLPALSFVALAAGAPLALAQTVVPAGSEIAFVSRQMGVPVEGHFRQWTADITFDPKAPGTGRVHFDVVTASAHFGAPDVEKEVKKPVWFDIARFPTASFRSSAIQATGPGRFDVSGRLTIKGQTRDIVVPVTLEGQTARGSFTIKRLAFRIGDGEWADTSMVADDVQVKFRLTLAGLTR